MDDDFFMSEAIQEAWKYQVLTFPNPPVGSVITKNNMLIAKSAHKKSGSAHAEVESIKQAYYILSNDKKILSLESSEDIHNFLYINHNNIFSNCTIYTTLEPCNHYGKTPPCSKLIEKLGFKKVVIGARDKSKLASGGISSLEKANIEISFSLEEKANYLLEAFLDYSQSQFIFFKYASSLNGVISGGYLTCDKSLDDVHRLRDKCDLLVIGGNTVRIDKPTLDSRRVKGKAPDILIYSKHNKFDKNIALFQIKDRKVIISDNLDIIKNYKCIMIEGGSAMLESVKEKVKYFLIYQSPNIVKKSNIQADINLNTLNYEKMDNDVKIWAIKV